MKIPVDDASWTGRSEDGKYTNEAGEAVQYGTMLIPGAIVDYAAKKNGKTAEDYMVISVDENQNITAEKIDISDTESYGMAVVPSKVVFGTDAATDTVSYTAVLRGMENYKKIPFYARAYCAIGDKVFYSDIITRTWEDVYYKGIDKVGPEKAVEDAGLELEKADWKLPSEASSQAVSQEIGGETFENYLAKGTDFTVAHTGSSNATDKWFNREVDSGEVNDRGSYILDFGENKKVTLSKISVYRMGDGAFKFYGSDIYDDTYAVCTDANLIQEVNLSSGDWVTATIENAGSYRYIYMTLANAGASDAYRDKAKEIVLCGTVKDIITVNGEEQSLTAGQVICAESAEPGVWYVNGTAAACGTQFVYAPQGGDVVTFTASSIVSIEEANINQEEHTFTTGALQAGDYVISLIAADGQGNTYSADTKYTVRKNKPYQFLVDQSGMPDGAALQSVSLARVGGSE